MKAGTILQHLFNRANDTQLTQLREAAQLVRDENGELALQFKTGRAPSFIPVISKSLESCDRCRHRHPLMIYPYDKAGNPCFGKLCFECWINLVAGIHEWSGQGVSQ